MKNAIVLCFGAALLAFGCSKEADRTAPAAVQSSSVQAQSSLTLLGSGRAPSLPSAAAALSAAPVAPSGSAQQALSGEWFDGTPDPSVRFTKTMTVVEHGLLLSVPAGWTGDDSYSEGMLMDSAPNGMAMVAVKTVGAVSEISDALAGAWIKTAVHGEVSWGPMSRSRIGKDHLAAQLYKGQGQLGKGPAEFWQFRVTAVKERTSMLVIAGLGQSASDEVRKQFIAAVRSIQKR